ncbi:MAG: (2Fe-2S) ferredoxin domain-containing protein [Candidatus Borkfalkiaceae bacterium]|nr:(2Fe-2S) ferredoxin domain-containing protein [Clostridia bacterium]MDY6224056.1 (2Fe-2S) ferredoxin domain-containing protein [Christensenellaceae bacterium]
MLNVRVCVGSSCYLKGSEKIVQLLQKYIAERSLKDKISLSGSFCAGKCNRLGVTVGVENEVYTGFTEETFDKFWHEKIETALNR